MLAETHYPTGGKRPGRSSPVAGSLLAVCLGLVPGCSGFNGTLEVLSGPPVRTSGGTRTYAVHVGEPVMIRFRVKNSLIPCDYAIAKNAATGWYSDCGTPVDGVFEWEQAFAGPTREGRPIHLKVEAISKVWRRDRTPVGGKIVRPRHAADQGDDLLAWDAVNIRVYQAVFEFEVSLPEGQPDWPLTRLTVYGKADASSVRRLARADRRGFTVQGPDEAGTWRVRYEALAREVRTRGRTDAVLAVADEAGRVTRFETNIETP